MQTQLYPAEYLDDSLERLLARYHGRGRGVYLAVLLTLAGAAAALPLLRVDVSVQSQGQVRPATEKHEVRARAAGVVQRLLVRENQRVEAGAPMLELRSGTLDEQSATLSGQIAEHEALAADLARLAGGGGGPFRSARAAQEQAQLGAELQQAALRRAQAERGLERARALAERGLAPAADVEQKDFELRQAAAEADQARQGQRSRWQAELAEAREALARLRSQRGQVEEDRGLYVVTAPVAGTVEEVQGVSTGSYVGAGEALAVISPSTGLTVEVLVSPADVGMIHPGLPVRFQVDAFDYNDWGFATGRVLEVSDDYVTVNQQPAFKVRCSLAQDHLALRSGVAGRLRKGMTLRARFLVARRSLLQLMFDRVDDWLNPAQA